MILDRWHGYTVDGQDALTQPNGAGAGYGTHPVDGRSTLRITQASGSTYSTIGDLGNAEAYSGHVRFRLSANPASQNSIFFAWRSSPTEAAFRVLVTGSGSVRFQDSTGANLSPDIIFTGGGAPGADCTLKWQIDTVAGTITARLWRDDTEVGTAQSSTGAFKPLGEFRVGAVLGTPLVPEYDVWDVRLSDALEWLEWSEDVPVAPSRNVAVIGDSLTYQSGEGWTNFATAAADFDPAQGAIYYQGVGGKEIAAPDFIGRSTLGQDIPFARRALGTVDTWIIALGTNDLLQSAPEAQFKADVTTVLDELDTERRVIWIGLASGNPAGDFGTYNTYLQDVIAGYPNAEFADWETASRDPFDAGDWVYPTDSVHMTPTGYVRRTGYEVALLEEVLGMVIIEWDGTVETVITAFEWDGTTETPLTAEEAA